MIIIMYMVLISVTPDAPSQPFITEVNVDYMVMTWEPPASDGGAPITQYIIDIKETESSTWKIFQQNIKLTRFQAEDLIKGKEYQFRVAGINKAGQGEHSEPSEPTVARYPFGM